MSLGVLPRPSSLATSYAQNYVPHPGLEWAEPLNTFLPEQNADTLMEEINAEWAATNDSKLALIEELRLFQARMLEKTGGHQPGQSVDSQNFTMADVLKAVEGASARSSSRSGASMHKFICSIGKHGPVLKQWLSLLPNGDYGSGICGAFTILLSATERIYSVDNLVYECLSKIPADIQKASSFIDIYRDQQPLELIKKAVDLYRSVLVALTKCVKYSRVGSSKRVQAKRFIGSVLKGDSFLQSLKDSVASVAENVTAVNEQAKMCEHRRIHSIFEMLKEDRRAQTESLETPIPLKQCQFIDVHNNLKGLLDSHVWLDRKGLLLENIEDVSPGNSPKQRKKKKKSKKKTTSPKISPRNREEMTAEDLLNLIAYNTFISVQDLQDVIHSTLSPEGNNLVAQAAKSDELHTFLHTPTVSGVLAIHANASDPPTLSPLSFLSSQLTQFLFFAESPIVLVYFCSLHAQGWDPRAGATMLIASLVGQLLDYPGLAFDLSFVDDEAAQLLEDDDFPELVQLFLSLLHQLPPDMSIFCFIDEVSVYETLERQGNMRKLLATLVKQVIDRQEEDGLPAFKLLLTDGKSTMVGDIVQVDNVLDLDEDLHEDDLDTEEVVGRAFE